MWIYSNPVMMQFGGKEGKKDHLFFEMSLKWNKGHRRREHPSRLNVWLLGWYSIPCCSTGLCFRWHWLLYPPSLWQPKESVEKHIYTHTHTAASFAMPPSPLSHHATKCFPITVLHICMPPHLSQRTKQRYAKQSGIPTCIAIRWTLWEGGGQELSGG